MKMKFGVLGGAALPVTMGLSRQAMANSTKDT